MVCLHFSRPPSHDPEESGDEDPDDSHTEDLSDLDNVNQVVNNAINSLMSATTRGKFSLVPIVDNKSKKDTVPSSNSVSSADAENKNNNLVNGKHPSEKDFTSTSRLLASLPNSRLRDRDSSSIYPPPIGPKDRFKVCNGM